MAATSLEDKVVLSSSPSASSKKKSKEKSGSSSSMKGTLSNSLFGGGSANNSLMSGGGVGGMGKMDVSDLPPFQQNDHSHSLTGLEGKLSNFVAGMKNHSSGLEMNNSSKSSKKKSGSESSNGSSSGGVGGGGGGGGMMANSTHLDGGGVGRSMGRGFSSGSSDGEDEKDQKKHIFRKKRGMKLPQSASGATIATSSIESDDEATDSADEGNSGGEERGSRRAGRKGDAIITTTTSGIGSLNLRQGDRVMSRKDSSESTNSATSPIPNPGHSTVFVESALPKEPLIGPNMPVGYGAAAESIAPTSGVFDKTTAQSPPGTPTMDSPKLVGDGAQFPGTPIALTPPPVESSEGQNSTKMAPPSSAAATPAGGVSTSGVPLNRVQPSPSLQGPSFNLPFENWVYQSAAAVYSPFPLSSSHPGSVATTPVAVEPGPYLRTGAPVFLRGTVCQESEGILIVSVQWRNKTFSGSLIDMNHHEWAPPRLAGGFDEPLAHLKDLCKQQEKRESESQQVNIDVEGDDSAKDSTDVAAEKMDTSIKVAEVPATLSATSKEVKVEGKPHENRDKGREEKMETSLVAAARPKLQSMESEPGEMEIAEEPSSSSHTQSPSTTTTSPQSKPKGGAAKVSVDSVYSDISDVSDSEEKGKKESSSQSSAHSTNQVSPFVASDSPLSQPPRGSRPKKIAAEEIQHTLPPFSAINDSSPTSSKETSSKNYDGRGKQRTSGEKEVSSDSSAASILRSSLMSSYPSSTASGTTTVSTPNQNHRHSFAGTTHGAVPGGPAGNTASSHGSHSSGDHSKNRPESAAKSASKPSNFSIDSINARVSSDSKEAALLHSHTLSIKRENRGRSTSPVHMAGKRNHPHTFSQYNASSMVHQDANKTTTLDYMPSGADQTFSKPQGAGDDSDSSGSGSLLSTHRKKKSGKQQRKKTELLSGIREDVNVKQPETPALGPIGIHNFNLKIQPISPGIDYPAQQQHMTSSVSKDVSLGQVVPVTKSAPSMGSPSRSPVARTVSPHPTTVGEAMGALLTVGGGGAPFKDGNMGNLVPRSSREGGEKGDKDPKDVPERHATGSSSSPSSVSSTSISGVSLGMPAPNYRPPQGVIQAPPQGKHELSSMKSRSPIPPDMLRQERERDPNQHHSRKRKNMTSNSTAGGEPGKHPAEHDDGGNPESSSVRSGHPPHAAFTFPQQPGFNIIGGENEKMDQLLPPDFNYDPNLPMTMQYQLLSFVNQKKQAQMKEYEDQLKEMNRKDKEEMERQQQFRQHAQQVQQQQQQQQQQQHPRPPKRPRIGEPHMNPGATPLQMPHPSSPANAKEHNSVKQKKPGHHPRMGGSHGDHVDERHFGQAHPVNIKPEPPFEVPRPNKPPGSMGKQPHQHPHSGHRAQPMPGSSSKQSSQKQIPPPQQHTTKADKLVIKTEDAQQPHLLPSGSFAGWPIIPVGVPHSNYQYSLLHAHALQQQSKEGGKSSKEPQHKEHKEPQVPGSQQHALFQAHSISAPIVALSQGWATAAPFMHPHSAVVQAGGSHAERTSRPEHPGSAVTTTTSVITGKPSSEMNSPHPKSHRSIGQSSPSSTSKKPNFPVGDGGSDRRPGVHKVHSHEHGRTPNSNSIPSSRRMESSSSSSAQRPGSYTGQTEGGGDSGRRVSSNSHSHPHSTSSSSSSSSTSREPSSSSRSHKQEQMPPTQQLLQAQAAAHQMSLLQQQQQSSISSPVVPGLQLRQNIPIGAAGLVQPNWEEWARFQELLQKGQQVGITSTDPWQQQMQQQMQLLAQQTQGVPMVPLADPNILIALQHQQQQQQAQQQQQQQQQHQSAEQQANAAALQNIQLLQAAAASGNMIPMLHPAMAGAHPAMAAGIYDQAAFGSMLPHFQMAATSQKRD